MIAGNTTPAGHEEDCSIGAGSPSPLAWSSAGGNVVGDSTCDLDQATDREGETEQGYEESGADGGVFNFGTEYLGSMGGRRLNAPVVGAAMRPGNQGYWEVADDGGVFGFGARGTSARWEAGGLTPRSSAWPRHPMEWVTGSSPRTAASSRSGTRPTTARWAEGT